MSKADMIRMDEIRNLFERLARGEDCSDWHADYYNYCGHMPLCKGNITIWLFNDCDVADYIEEIVVGGRVVYQFGVPKGNGEWDWDVAVSPEWRKFGREMNNYITQHVKEISRSLFGRCYIHEDTRRDLIRIRYEGDAP